MLHHALLGVYGQRRRYHLCCWNRSDLADYERHLSIPAAHSRHTLEELWNRTACDFRFRHYYLAYVVDPDELVKTGRVGLWVYHAISDAADWFFTLDPLQLNMR